MADEKLMVETTLLIDFSRKSIKPNAKLFRHFEQYDKLYISSVTEFEVINGANASTSEFWNQMISKFLVLNFDSIVARQAANIVAQLKPKRKRIDKSDLFIAATAVAHGLTLDTANKKHFIHIDDLKLLAD